jgi:hypothetical protein
MRKTDNFTFAHQYGIWLDDEAWHINQVRIFLRVLGFQIALLASEK